jgi:N-acetylmuramoyl-L-alanine amidase
MAEILKLGSKGPAVKAWQEFLKGLVRPALQVDSDFGPATRAATETFQAQAGVTRDGMVGPNTIAAAKERGFKGFPGDLVAALDPDAVSHSAFSKAQAALRSGKLILVSAGHSNVPPRDPGAVGSGFTEAILTVELRDAVAAEIRRTAEQHSVIEDGSDGKNDPLSKALVLARRADVAVEFHWNASSNPSAHGVEVLSKPGKKALAQRLAVAIHNATGITLRGDLGWKPDNSGQHHRLAFCEAGGLIVEVCFISSRDDMVRYRENFREVVSNLAAVLASA